MEHLKPFKQIYDAHKGDPNFMLSLARGIEVLLAFSERKTPLSISEIALKTSLDRAVVRRCVYTLVQLGMMKSDGRKYVLEARILSLGHAYFSSADLITKAQPLLDQLSKKIHTNCALAILSDGDILYLVRSQNRSLMPRSLGMGSRLPAHCTSLGRVLLAHLSAKDLDAYLASARLQPLTSFTITDEQALRTILNTTRRNGYAVVDQEMAMDLAAIAVPVHMRGYNGLMAMSVTVSSRHTPAAELKDRYLESMLETAQRLLDI